MATIFITQAEWTQFALDAFEAAEAFPEVANTTLWNSGSDEFKAICSGTDPIKIAAGVNVSICKVANTTPPCGTSLLTCGGADLTFPTA